MADLTLAPPRDRNPLPAVLIAAAVLAAVAAGVFYLNPRKTAELTVTKTALFGPHTTFKATPGATHVIGNAEASEDNLYVVVTAHLEDKLRFPIFLDSFTASFLDAVGASHEATVIPARDLPRLQEAFPALTPLTPQPLHDGDEVATSSSADGTITLLFSGATEATWRTRKSATLTIGLRNQAP